MPRNETSFQDMQIRYTYNRPFIYSFACHDASEHSNRCTCMMDIEAAPRYTASGSIRVQEDFVGGDLRHNRGR